MTVRRSWLIVPAYDSDALTEAGDAKPDVVVLDLQDTVHDHKKHEARSKIRDSISYVRERGAELFVRVDVDLMYADLLASVWPGLTGIVLPGATEVSQVVQADRMLGDLEEERGVSKPPMVGEIREADDPKGPGQLLEIHLSLDTGRGNWDAVDLIESSNRIKSVSLGRADVVMDLRGEPSGDLHLMPYLMQRLVTIASATKVEPVGGWWRATSRGLQASYNESLRAARFGRKAGFTGALCMKPIQVEALNLGFSPSVEEKVWANSILDSPGRSDGSSKHGLVSDGIVANGAALTIAAQVLQWDKYCESRNTIKS